MRLVVPKEKDGLLLSQVLFQCAEDVPLWAVREAMKNRDVRLDGARIRGDCRVRAGQEIRVYWPKAALQKHAAAPLPVVYQDEHVLLAVKPQGLPAQREDDPSGGDTALTRVRAQVSAAGGDGERVRLCHRLDVQTGGLLLFAKDDAAYDSAVRAFEARTFRKFYVCLVKGMPTRPQAVLHAYLRKDAEAARVSVTDDPVHGAREIVTAYRVLGQERRGCARLEVELITGRTHQIRAHLAHIGHPILGDDKYGDRALNRALGVRRQQLFATRMIFQAEGALAYLNGRCFETACPF